MESTLEKRFNDSIVKDHISITNLATKLNVSPRWVQNRIDDGDFRAVRTTTEGKGNGKMLIEVASISEYLAKNRVAPKNAVAPKTS